eukprot:3937836-Rhodomonas_salina.4
MISARSPKKVALGPQNPRKLPCVPNEIKPGPAQWRYEVCRNQTQEKACLVHGVLMPALSRAR